MFHLLMPVQMRSKAPKPKPPSDQQQSSRQPSKPWSTRSSSGNRRPLPIFELLFLAIALGLWYWGKWLPLEHSAYNVLYQTREAISPGEGWSDRLTVIAIDDATLNELDRFPLKRSDYADVLDTLNVALPAVVGFDLLFTESTPEDAVFAEAIANNWVTVLALSDGLSRNSGMELVPELVESAAATGHVHSHADADGTVRSVDLYYNNPVDDQRVPTLAIAILKVYEEAITNTIAENVPEMPTLPVWLSADDKESQYRTRQGDRTVWINWPAPVEPSQQAAASRCNPEFQPGELQIYSFACVVNDRVAPEVFANKIVLIGATAQGMDPMMMPFNREAPSSGVFLHAALIDNLLTDRLLQDSPRWMEGLLLVGVGITVAIAMRRLKLIGRFAIVIGVPLVWFAAAVVALHYSWWIPVAAPIGTAMLMFVGTQIRDQMEKQQLMHLFKVYVSPETARHIWQRKQTRLQKTTLELEKLVVTVLFVDIRRFTTISETLPPEQLMPWLNCYLDTMTTCITDHGGWVDKYIGDEIMAVFGNPDEEPTDTSIRENAQRAIAASLAMHERLQQLNETFQSEGLPTIQFGIGIHTGSVVAGNVGGAKRYNYSIVGDTVNVASRLQGLNKDVTDHNPLHVLMSGTTYEHASDRFLGYPVGQLKLRGRSQEMLVYSLQAPQECAIFLPS